MAMVNPEKTASKAAKPSVAVGASKGKKMRQVPIAPREPDPFPDCSLPPAELCDGRESKLTVGQIRNLGDDELLEFLGESFRSRPEFHADPAGAQKILKGRKNS